MDRYWVGGTASWDGTAGTKWAATVGGAGGASVPTSADDVYFDAASGAVTCTLAATSVCRALNFTGFTGTFAGASTLSVSGGVTFVPGMTLTYSGLLNFVGTSTFNFDTGGKTLAGNVQLNSASLVLNMQSALTNLGSLTIAAGTFSTNNYNVTTVNFISNSGTARTLNFGSSTISISGTGTPFSIAAASLTFNAGTSQVNLTSASSTGLNTLGVTFYNVTATSATTTFSIAGANTFNNLTVAGPASAGVVQVTFDSRTTINGTLSTIGTAGNRRVWFRGLTYGIAQTLTINSAPSLTDADFRDIYVIGTAAPISGTRIGDLRGIRGITASTPKTVYWNLAAGGFWSANAWAASSGGGVSTDNFPLAQDTAIIENTGLNTSATVTLNSAITYIGSFNMSTRTNAMTFSASVNPTFYGNLTLGSGVTYNANLGTMTLSGRNTQTITSAGKTLGDITVNSYGGTVELADALNIGSRTLTVTNGTFDTKNYNVTAGSLSSSNSNVRTITLGSSTVTLSSTVPLVFTTTTNFTFNAGTSQITGSSISGDSNINFGGLQFYNFTITIVGTPLITINGANTFNNLTLASPTSAGIQNYIFSANQTITGTLTCAGATAVRRVFLQSSTLGTTRTLTVGTLTATDCDFRDITIAGAAAGSSPTRAGDCGGNTGITFPAAKTVYWNLAGSQNWSATGWCPSSGGTPDINQFPLAQDTAVFDDTGAAGTVSITASWNIGTLNMSGRTSAMTFNIVGASPSIYGNFLFGTGITPTGTVAIIFAGRSTQAITSNGVIFTNDITIDSVTGTVQLADALTLGATRALTLTSGTFDAVTYNVTTGVVLTGSGTKTLRMGSGTWALSGNGTVWDMSNGAINFFKGTANIVLSTTSASVRNFFGANLSYNKLTVGGATGTSTLTIFNNNQFTELASTKTVAHTIGLGTTTQTFGAWTVTGTAGNVVTLTGTGTSHILAGACTSGIDYLAMGSIGFAATSPGEFYAGANSTGTAAAPVYRTAKPADSTRYWVGGTGNWSDTARWSTSSGGGSGASVPRSHDDVVFDLLSNATAYTATVNAVTGGIRTKALTIAGPLVGNLTLAGSTAMDGIHGNVTLPATGLTRTYTGAITLSGSATGRTLTTNGATLASAITVDGVGCGWTLGSALDAGTTGFTITNGTFSCSTYNFTASQIASNNANTRTVTFGSGTITLSGSSPVFFGTAETNRANLTVVAGTAQLNWTSANPSLSGNNQTFYNVAFTSTSAGTVTLNGVNTFNNLSFTGITSAGLKIVSVTANQTINGTLTLSAGTDATRRHFVRSDTIGTTRTLTCAAFSGTDADFRDITIAGAAAPVSGTRLGDCKGNSGITFGAGVTRYWNLAGSNNWSATGWAASSGASPAVNNFPLAQDTVVFESTSPGTGTTTTINADYNIGTIDMSARTSNTMTLATGTTLPSIYGNWINGTGTTLTGTGAMTFAGRGSQTITSAGRTFTQGISIDTPSGSVTLQDAFVCDRAAASTLLVRAGTFNANIYNVTLTAANSQVSAAATTTTRQLGIGSGTWTIAGSSGFSVDPTNFTVTGTGTISLTSASAKAFTGGGVSYSGITLNQGGAGTLTITGNNTFKSITNTYSATGATTIAIGTTTQTLTQPWTAEGQAARVLTVQGTSAASPATLVFTGSGVAASVDYLVITGVRAYDLTDEWYAGANSTNNGSLGWYFEAGGVIAISASVSETSTASDAVVAFLTFLASTSESATATDSISTTGALNSSLSETATATDAINRGLTLLAQVADAATAADTTAAQMVLSTNLAETATATDAVFGSFVFASVILESATATDTTQAATIFVGAIAETATATDLTASLAQFLAQVAETSTATDVTLVAPSVFGAQVQEAVAALDLVSAFGTFNVQFVDSATALDSVIGAYLWNLIDDSQGGNWTTITTYTNAIPSIWAACAASPTSVVILNAQLPGAYLLVANGLAQTLQLPGTAYYAQATYVNGYFYAFNTFDATAPLLRSADGATWETVIKPTSVRPVVCVFGNGTQLGIVINGGGGFGMFPFISTDNGATWVQGTDFGGGGDQSGQAVWDGAKYVMCMGRYIWSSANGLNWAASIFTSGMDRGQLVWDGTTYVSLQCTTDIMIADIRPSVVSVSNDGINWTTVPATTASGTGSVLMLSGGKFIVVNYYGAALQLDAASNTFTALGQAPSSTFPLGSSLGATAATLNGAVYLPAFRPSTFDGTYLTTRDFASYTSSRITNWAAVGDSQSANWQNINNT